MRSAPADMPGPNSGASSSSKSSRLLRAGAAAAMLPLSDAFCPPVAIGRRGARYVMTDRRRSASMMLMVDNKKVVTVEEAGETTTKTRATNVDAAMLSRGVDRVFDAVDADGSGGIDREEYNLHLASAGYSEDAVRESFLEMDSDGDGEISRDELRGAIASRWRMDGGGEGDEDCPMGYWLNSVRRTCQPLGPLGRMSQRIETLGPLKNVYRCIANVFGVNREALRKRGIPFLLTYSIISNLNGALSLTVAWYMTVKRTGLSPLVPGQKKSLLASYAMIYGALQLLKPFRVAAAVAMSKLSADCLDVTQERLGCSRNAAVGCQYATGMVMMGITFCAGVAVVSLITGVPVWG